jgi:thiamine biosynthesis lipoprotein
MRETRFMMGMPVTIEIADPGVDAAADIEAAFATFDDVDRRFSTYRPDSEISRINQGLVTPDAFSDDMREVFARSDETRAASRGYFDIRRPDGSIDPSGLVKGWAIQRVADQLAGLGYEHYFVDAGGDIQTNGKNADGGEWSAGIQNPFDTGGVVKVVFPHGGAIATSGTYIRGDHIYDPHRPGEPLNDVVSLTVVGPSIYDADRFATIAFAMGKDGIYFIEDYPGLEGFMIGRDGIGTETSQFERYTSP